VAKSGGCLRTSTASSSVHKKELAWQEPQNSYCNNEGGLALASPAGDRLWSHRGLYWLIADQIQHIYLIFPAFLPKRQHLPMVLF